MFIRNIGFFIVLSILFVLALFPMPPTQAKFSLFERNEVQSQDRIKEKEILKMLKHYLTWKIPKSYEALPHIWEDGSGISINVKPKKPEGLQDISLSIVKQEEDNFYSLPEIVSIKLTGDGRDLGTVAINGFQWARYMTGYQEGTEGSHRCAATVHKDFVIWMCLSPEDTDHPASGIPISVFEKFLKSIRIKRDAYFIPTNEYIASRQFNSIYKKLHHCSSFKNEDAWSICVKESTEKGLRICQKFKKDCDYLAEQVKHARLLGTDEEEISDNEVFDNISGSLDSLRSGGSSLPKSEFDE